MKRQIWTIVLAGALGVGLLFTLLVATTQLSRAQEQPPQNTEQPQSPLGTTFTYQGAIETERGAGHRQLLNGLSPVRPRE